MRDIVRAADVNLASVNYYFGGKEGLYAATLTELAAERVAKWPRIDHDLRPEEQLHAHVLMVIQRVLGIERGSPLGRIIAHEAMNPTPYLDHVIGHAVQPEFERLQAIVRAVSRERLDERQVAAATFSIMGQCFFFLFARGAVDLLEPGYTRPERADQLAGHITRFSIGAIQAMALKAAGSP